MLPLSDQTVSKTGDSEGGNKKNDDHRDDFEVEIEIPPWPVATV